MNRESPYEQAYTTGARAQLEPSSAPNGSENTGGMNPEIGKTAVRYPAESGPHAARIGELIQLTRKGVVFSGTQEDLNSLRSKYDRDNYVILPHLFESALLNELIERIDAAPFLPRDHDGIGLELCMEDEITSAMLMFFPNNPAFLRLVEKITGHAPIGEFNGRVYRMTSSDGHFDLWHDDCSLQRVATMSVNLSRQIYSGGALQMKYRNSGEILHEIHNIGFGDALLFRISRNLAHRVQDVTGDIPKTAFAGWFLEGEDLLSNLWKRASATSGRLINKDTGT